MAKKKRRQREEEHDFDSVLASEDFGTEPDQQPVGRGRARVIPAWDDEDADSIRRAKERGLSRGEYHKRVQDIQDNLDKNIRELIEAQAPEDREMLLSIIRDMRDRGGAEYSMAFQAVHEIDYKYPPVPIGQFLDDDYYLGQFTETLFPKWREELCQIFAPGAQYGEWLLGGSIGAGKTFTAMIANAYLIYRMSCLRDPQRYYNLAYAAGKIVFGIYSVTVTQASDVGYDVLRSFVENSPYFSEKFPFNQKMKRRIDFLDAPISVRVGSREFHALGQNLFALTMDEANFMQQVSKKEKKREKSNVLGQAEKIYNAAVARLKSRYIRPGGTVPGMMILISSKQDQQAFLERRKTVAANEIAAQRVRVSEFSQWIVRPKERYTAPRFYVEIGDRLYPSRILQAKTRSDAEREARQGSDVLEVPGEFKSEFARDPEQALRDIAGVATFGLTPLIRERARIYDCILPEEEGGWQHPFTKQEITLSDQDDVALEDFFEPTKVFRVLKSRYTPRIDPTMPRAVHLDVAFTGDSCGLACGHVHDFVKVIRHNGDGTEYEDRVPIIYIDFMLRIMPPARGEIPLAKIRAFLQYLREMGLPIAHVSADDYQSRDTLQILRALGFETAKVSMDKNDEPYMGLKSAVYEKRARYYRHDWFIKELEHLERDLDTCTVDHPQMFDENTPGSKDVSDSVCGVVHVCTINPALCEEVQGTTVAVGGDPRATRDILFNPGDPLDWSKVQKVRNAVRSGR